MPCPRLAWAVPPPVRSPLHYNRRPRPRLHPPSPRHFLPIRHAIPSPRHSPPSTSLPCQRRAHATLPPAATAPMVAPSPTPYAAELSAAVRAVAAASAVARRVQLAFRADDALAKPDASPVTVADFAVQAIIVHLLHAAFPRDCFIAEESATALREDPALLAAVAAAAALDAPRVLAALDLCDHAGGDGARTWILDPIDGTRGYIAARQYCIALGLVQAGVPRIGVLGCPSLPRAGMAAVEKAGADAGTDDQLGYVFFAEQARGAYMLAEADALMARETTPFFERAQRCAVSDVRDVREGVFCESVERAHSSHELSARVAAILGVTRAPVRMDSQAKYGCMARGDASIFLRFPRDAYVENVWDSAPATIVLEEAGGKVTDGRGRPLDFSLGRKMDNDDGIVATNGLLHDQVIAAVQQAITEARSK